MAEPMQPPSPNLETLPSTPTPGQQSAKTFVIGAAPEADPLVDDAAIRPFAYRASDEDLADLKSRILATRWPDRETVEDDVQGVQLATMQKLADYWANEVGGRRLHGFGHGNSPGVSVEACGKRKWAVENKHAQRTGGRRCNAPRR